MIIQLDPLTPMSDQDRISPYNIKQTNDEKKGKKNKGTISRSNTKFSKLTSQELYGGQ